MKVLIKTKTKLLLLFIITTVIIKIIIIIIIIIKYYYIKVKKIFNDIINVKHEVIIFIHFFLSNNYLILKIKKLKFIQFIYTIITVNNLII